ncbi:hypothetical protein [Haloarcula argentinensis]|uniref:Uncharacterized protein n=1 Tax=Haloarcula argentinensis TaxID=43776 RepID=A0A830FQH2_HALAR|nr:hypothetical protein [Haloarcula argentinensis]EMA18640.1 hypothetical protein C443_19129 [Haloarcula argentinensis DSM 12282]MDS0253797.1 hypothetical protein [Haloarcula argentinensis]GGM46690.1 hypothetical protein GCM10009006_29930 [Haloarcula argentinensis]
MDSGIFRDSDGTYNKRFLGLALLVLLAVIGAGVGTLGLTDNSDSAPDQPATELTPRPTETPTETPDRTDSASTESGGSASPPPSALLSETPTPAPNQSDGNTTNTTVE